jgi:hypothetical protein
MDERLIPSQLIWALVTADGAGEVISAGSTAQGSALSWNSLFGLQTLVGAYVGGCLGQSGGCPFPPFPRHDYPN